MAPNRHGVSEPVVQWYLPSDPADWPTFAHRTTSVTSVDLCAALGCGGTVWTASLGANRMVIAWEWIETRPGVPVIADINDIATNILFVVPDGMDEGLLSVVMLNRVVHLLPWQEHVRNLLTHLRRSSRNRVGVALGEARGAGAQAGAPRAKRRVRAS